MSAGKKKLTEAPKDLKEAIDWVLCMSGYDDQSHYDKGIQAIQALAGKLKSLLGSVAVDKVNATELLKGDTSSYHNGNFIPIQSLGIGLNALIDQSNGIGNNYAYSYSDEDPSKTVDEEKYAKMFLGMVPLLFFGLGFLFYMCRRDGGKWSKRRFLSGPLKSS
ncbi:variant erythrocyte surface antigen-1 family protein [Babesia caballi]|uniref:Variant erythrocyte surface antigen-1 family protein n=1 Tax=Babesia caballi TaxID=5871 RepID=A0AAV4LZ12_BABCB|nr:variant erythrocyte surface antigen-1 family protein [Babesia caballi]